MKVDLAYGRGQLSVDLPDDRVTVIRPSNHPGLPDEKTAVVAALQNPIGARPLLESIGPSDRVCIAFTDITRATPNQRTDPSLSDPTPHGPTETGRPLSQHGA